ncbi:DUF6056 family protein [Frigoriflavimonas asaccharolytica]|uniref:Uncharacterized protein n=1 Tax=Frigoriflavimonas asaccharolytica TaxID=2735899 RepID=A0A8J8K851_9FLAO|nr:DUF6056 family protein [Frigoriflavimonas asaccharolytica]NRS92658.1 hypothetical protein [Frigoriflavimonas asaccharolytica]
MKKSNIPYFVLIFVNIAIALSCYFYPVFRDEFYYLNKVNYPNAIQEYIISYYFGNARIGQFFSNLVSRNIFLEVLFGVLLFNAFITALFLNIYRKLPDFRDVEMVKKFLWIAGFFILFINYFGEMFYYTPFSTNYTFTHVFYLLYVYLLSEYFLHGNKALLKKTSYFVLPIFGVFIGMSNEHVPPILVGISFLFALIYYLKNKKLPDFRLLITPLFIIVGYALLFFAPSNKIKQELVGKSVLDIGFSDYIANWVKILKTYFYYNQELLGLVFFVIVAIVVWNSKFKKVIYEREKILFWILLFVLPLCIVAVSPLIGTRLLFFSNSILLIVVYQIILKLGNEKFKNTAHVFLCGFLIVFSTISILFTFKANQNYDLIVTEILQKRNQSKDIVLDNQLYYFQSSFGNYLNRKIFLESGEDYIDKDPAKDTTEENNLKLFYNLHSIKEK